jgi:tubulin polyglutamylase TTLL9
LFSTDIHITNNAVQKQAPGYDPDKGAKWGMRNLREFLTAKYGLTMVNSRIFADVSTRRVMQLRFKVENMLRLMDEIFIKSLQSVQKIIINDKHCFELYGYDILLDSNLKP